MVAYKVVHGLADLSMGEAGISLQKGVTRGSGLRLSVLRARTESIESHFNSSIVERTTFESNIAAAFNSI